MRKWILLKPISILVVAMVVFFSSTSAFVQAAMIGTDESLARQSAQLDRQKLQRLLERSDVRNQLAAWGVQPEEARAVVDNLTDAEIREMAGNMEALPAGGNAVGVIVGAALVVFLVLLITDILGYTNVFPFVKNGV
jgi:hypothetical protein